LSERFRVATPGAVKGGVEIVIEINDLME